MRPLGNRKLKEGMASGNQEGFRKHVVSNVVYCLVLVAPSGFVTVDRY